MDIILTDLLRPETIIEYGGIAFLLFIIFAETGLFFGFFLPGDSLLFVAGLLCGSPILPFPLWLLVTLVIVTAVSGTLVGYGFGLWAKGYLSRRHDNFFYKKKYLEITRRFYHKYGMATFVVGRFLPIIRTFVPILAGIVRIDFRTFLFYNFLGAVCWVVSMITAGYLLGKTVPGIEEHLDLIVICMVLISAVPVVISWTKHRRSFVE